MTGATLPLWAAIVVAVGSPLVSFLGVWLGLRRSARDPGSVLDDEDRLLIEAVLGTVVGPAVQAYSSGDTVEEDHRCVSDAVQAIARAKPATGTGPVGGTERRHASTAAARAG